MKKLALSILFASSIIFINACSSDDSKKLAKEQNDVKFDDSDVESDASFAVNVADANMLEIELGILAQSKAHSKEAKGLGKKMRDQHTRANNELKDLAAQKNISLPMGLSDQAKKKYDFLASKNGRDFDKSYSDFMVEDHGRAIGTFEKEVVNGKDPDFRNWANKKLPELKQHLQMSRGTQYVLATSDDKGDNK